MAHTGSGRCTICGRRVAGRDAQAHVRAHARPLFFLPGPDTYRAPGTPRGHRRGRGASSATGCTGRNSAMNNEDNIHVSTTQGIRRESICHKKRKRVGYSW